MTNVFNTCAGLMINFNNFFFSFKKKNYLFTVNNLYNCTYTKVHVQMVVNEVGIIHGLIAVPIKM